MTDDGGWIDLQYVDPPETFGEKLRRQLVKAGNRIRYFHHLAFEEARQPDNYNVRRSTLFEAVGKKGTNDTRAFIRPYLLGDK